MPRVKCPEWLSQDGKAEWKRLAPILERDGRLTAAEKGPFAAYCEAWGSLCEASRQIREHGEVFTTPNGYQQQTPWVGIRTKALQQIAKYASEFGLTPAAQDRHY